MPFYKKKEVTIVLGFFTKSIAPTITVVLKTLDSQPEVIGILKGAVVYRIRQKGQAIDRGSGLGLSNFRKMSAFREIL